jgi:hypothetical protein
MTDKCAIRGCRVRGAELVVWSAEGCSKGCHLMCYQGIILKSKNGQDVTPLPENRVCCTKTCYVAIVRSLSSNDSSRGKWNGDGKKGADDPHTSMKILLDWMLEEGNYSKYCGKDNNGVRKQHFATILATKMKQETLSESRTPKQVMEKIRQLEESFRDAHVFATSETGAGIQEKEGNETFQSIVKKKCAFYYELCEIMADRSRSKPKLTNNDASDLDIFSEDEEEEDSPDSPTDSPNQDVVIQNLNQVAPESNPPRSARGSAVSSLVSSRKSGSKKSSKKR